VRGLLQIFDKRNADRRGISTPSVRWENGGARREGSRAIRQQAKVCDVVRKGLKPPSQK